MQRRCPLGFLGLAACRAAPGERSGTFGPAVDSTRAAPIRAEAEVLENRCEGGVNHRLRLRAAEWPGFAPGQFVMLSPGALGAAPRSDPLLPRPMAVYAEGPEPGSLEVRYKRVGRGTALLAAASPGERIRLLGPLGSGFVAPPSGVPVLVVAGGTGIASVYALVRSLGGSNSVRVLLGAQSVSDLVGLDDFSALGVDVRVATEDGSSGAHGLVTQLLEEALAQTPAAHVYTCGPTPMMRRCAELAQERGATCIASLENRIACGFGVCLGCAAPLSSGGMALVCCDGPVFDAARIDWEGLA